MVDIAVEPLIHADHEPGHSTSLPLGHIPRRFDSARERAFAEVGTRCCELTSAHDLRGRGEGARPCPGRAVVSNIHHPTAAPRRVHALTYTDPFGLCPPVDSNDGPHCPTRGGTKASASQLRAASDAASARPKEKDMSLEVSATIVNTSLEVSGSGVSMTAVAGPPQLGASLDVIVPNSSAPSSGNVPVSVDLGAGKHLGVSINVAVGKDRPQVLGGGALHLGFGVGSPGVQASVTLPAPQPVVGGYSCAKMGVGC